MPELGIVIVSHSADIAKGLVSLIREVAPDIPLTATGGLEDGGLGSSFDHVQIAVDSQPANRLLAFYDLGSARMNLEMVEEFSDKDILIQQVPLIEGAYTASALLQAGASEVEILSQVRELTIQNKESYAMKNQIKYKWASLGTGVIANELAQALEALGGKLYSVANRTYDKGVTFAEKYGIEKVYKEIDEVFEDPEVDIIYISTPHNTHINFLRKALAGRKTRPL